MSAPVRWFVTLSVAAMVAACGSSPAPAQSYDQSHTATQINSDAAKAVQSITSAHVALNGTDSSGQQLGLDLDIQGKNFNGTISMGGQSIKIMSVDGKIYVYGPDLLVLSPISDPTTAARIKALVGSNWVVFSSSGSVGSALGSAFDFSTISGCFTALTGLTKKGTSAIDGDAVVEIDDQSGGQFFIEISSPHYPRRMVFTANTCTGGSSSGAGTLDLTKENTSITITAPTNTVDATTLGLS